jgi:hypothetical protein
MMGKVGETSGEGVRPTTTMTKNNATSTTNANADRRGPMNA